MNKMKVVDVRDINGKVLLIFFELVFVVLHHLKSCLLFFQHLCPSAPLAKVKRDGKIITVASEELVRGDIVILEAGNYVPADCRLFLNWCLWCFII